ncbi:hypothetical protein QLQ15_09155 [Lysobacter sp. LF1]|uniref:DUF998 domain-containing protein n=1 Tax=Lysobacter stagni TaxID=3045172 RepID=A0ABT6XH31_9GAMM|nr:hypothetical protein [Lysobacter sp. LF1]MDI9239075.1 hypothetical protein [Lysobacter sp. LF1]
MDAGASPRLTVPLWPLPLLAALMPFVVGHLAWWLSVRDGLVPGCNLYWDGCVSISRAARHGVGNHLFRLVMLPCATVQVLCWFAAALWLRGDTPARARMLPWLGLLAGVFLALYATFLGTEGRAYEAMRRYGINLYFGFTYLALMATLHALSRTTPRRPGYRPLLVVALGFMALGLASVFVRYALDDEVALDRWENALEWHLGLWLTAMFAVLAWRWWRDGVRITLV